MNKRLPLIIKKLAEYYKLPHSSVYLGMSHELTNNGHRGNDRAALKTVMRNLKANPSHYHDLDPKYANWHMQQSSGLGDKQSAVNRQLQQDGKINESSYSYVKYWFTPDGRVVNAGDSHEGWIIKNDSSIPRGATLLDTYESAIKKGYVRGIYDTDTKFLMLSNLPNYDFAMSSVKMPVVKAIKGFIAEKNIDLVGSGKGRILSDFSREQYAETIGEIKDAHKLMEGWKDLAAAAAIGLSTMTGASAADKARDVKITQTAKKPAELNKFLNALHQVETSGRSGHIVGDKGKALGPLQIHKSYWQDVKNIVGGKYEDVENLNYSKKVVLAYLNKYGRKAFQQGDWETLAKIHNGGPDGANNPNTQGYWKKVKRHLNEYFGFNYYF